MYIYFYYKISYSETQCHFGFYVEFVIKNRIDKNRY